MVLCVVVYTIIQFSFGGLCTSSFSVKSWINSMRCLSCSVLIPRSSQRHMAVIEKRGFTQYHCKRDFRHFVFRYGLLGPIPIYDNTSYCKISHSLEAERFALRIAIWLWNLTGTSAALLPTCLSNFKVKRTFKLPISRRWDFVRSHD